MKTTSINSGRSGIDAAIRRPALLIRDHGGHATLRRPPRELLAALAAELAFVRREFAVDARGGLRRDRDAEALFEIDRDGELHVPSGLVPRLVAAAGRAGYSVDVQDGGNLVVPASMVDLLGEREDIVRLAAALAGSRRGVLAARSRGHRLAALRLIIRLFPAGKIMVFASTRAEAKKIARDLSSRAAEPIACFTRQLTRSDVRVQVGTLGGLDPTVAGVVVFADARQALHARARRDLAHLGRQRIYGLLDDRAGLGRRERLLIEAGIGPVIGRLGAADEFPVVVRAVFADWTGGELPDLPLGLAWKRESIWHNPARNAAIARLASALVAGDDAPLWEHGLFLGGEGAARPPADPTVVVLVESPEHARGLAQLLPGWAVRSAERRDSAADDDTGAGGPGRRDSGEPARRAIATWLYARDQGQVEADIVLRADGTPWPLGVPFVPPGPRTEGRVVLLVDLDDGQDRTARAATNARRADYRDRGWDP